MDPIHIFRKPDHFQVILMPDQDVNLTKTLDRTNERDQAFLNSSHHK